ncbi:MAG: hypothetical protein LBM93_08450 [Oscillospiraceae bacterium]|jgi:uncharacterized protein YkwD|nr:hypothetical protein [Oscillospiraceae bacterium]
MKLRIFMLFGMITLAIGLCACDYSGNYGDTSVDIQLQTNSNGWDIHGNIDVNGGGNAVTITKSPTLRTTTARSTTVRTTTARTTTAKTTTQATTTPEQTTLSTTTSSTTTTEATTTLEGETTTATVTTTTETATTTLYTTTTALQKDVPGHAASIVKLVNNFRYDSDLNKLLSSSDLNTVANVRSNELSVKYDEIRPQGTLDELIIENNVSCTYVGELILKDINNPDKAFEEWLNTPEALVVVKDEKFKKIGASSVLIDDVYYWSIVFTD